MCVTVSLHVTPGRKSIFRIGGGGGGGKPSKENFKLSQLLREGAKRSVCHPNIFIGGDCTPLPPPPPRIDASRTGAQIHFEMWGGGGTPHDLTLVRLG